jgi:uncharacterized protein YhjY with autotransporter beta-barrel domain
MKPYLSTLITIAALVVSSSTYAETSTSTTTETSTTTSTERRVAYPNIPIEQLGQKVVVDPSIGLVVKNEDQKPGAPFPVPMYLNYEIDLDGDGEPDILFPGYEITPDVPDPSAEEEFLEEEEEIEKAIQEYDPEVEPEFEKLVEEIVEAEFPGLLPHSSTVTATGTAQRDALRGQMFSMRDCIANLGGRMSGPVAPQEFWVQPSKDGSVPGHFVKSSAPATATDVQYHLWVEGNGGYTNLDEQSGRGGYRLQTWGGTVGAAASLENNLTLGAAFSAQWGDLTSSGGQEWASGDLDSLYLHLFAHYQSNAWGHTLLLTGTKTDAKLNRRGYSYGEDFSTQGDTDGYGVGALYELTYDIPMNDAGTTMLQPLFDASIVHTQLDAYSETGTGDRNLNVGKQEWTTGSVALGARLSGSFGSESLGHPFFGEVRVSVSEDFGDTRGKASVSDTLLPWIASNAYGSEVGATAVQVGAGISTPLSSWSTLYANVGADFREREDSVGGAAGVKFTF